MYRTEDFDEYLASELQNIEFARGYLLELMKEVDGEPGLELWSALKHLIQGMGQTEFANLCGKEQPAINRYLKQESCPKVATLNELLSPLGLEVDLTVKIVA